MDGRVNSVREKKSFDGLDLLWFRLRTPVTTLDTRNHASNERSLNSSTVSKSDTKRTCNAKRGKKNFSDRKPAVSPQLFHPQKIPKLRRPNSPGTLLAANNCSLKKKKKYKRRENKKNAAHDF